MINGNLSFIKDGQNFGYALENNDELKEGSLYLTVMLFDENDTIEIINPEIE